MTPAQSNKKESIGFIGLGAMGLPMAAKLVNEGFDLKVHTRSRKAEQSKRLKGAKPCESFKDAAAEVDVLMICVSDDEAVEMVLFGKDGAEKSLIAGSIVIDMSTISPSKAMSCATRLAKKNISYVDAPVSGGTEGAEAGTLTIFFGGNNAFLMKVAHILNSIGDAIYAFGSVGKGQSVKAINQILVAGSYAAVAEAIALGEALKLPMDKVIQALQKGAASSWALSNRSEAMLKGNYPLGFKLELHHKDLCIALKAAEESGLKLPIAKKVKEIEESLIIKGYKNDDISVLRESLKAE